MSNVYFYQRPCKRGAQEIISQPRATRFPVDYTSARGYYKPLSCRLSFGEHFTLLINDSVEQQLSHPFIGDLLPNTILFMNRSHVISLCTFARYFEPIENMSVGAIKKKIARRTLTFDERILASHSANYSGAQFAFHIIIPQSTWFIMAT